MTISAQAMGGTGWIEVSASDLVEILRDYGDRENEDSYNYMSDQELVDEFTRAGMNGRERDYIRESAEDAGFNWRTVTTP